MLSQDCFKLRRYCKDGIENVENYDKERWALARIASN